MTYLDMSGPVSRKAGMAAIKISSKVDETLWEEFREFSRDSHRSISGLLTEAIREYLARRRIRPDVIRHLGESMAENEELGKLLAE